jgi:hypothetical protein
MTVQAAIAEQRRGPKALALALNPALEIGHR